MRKGKRESVAGWGFGDECVSDVDKYKSVKESKTKDKKATKKE